MENCAGLCLFCDDQIGAKDDNVFPNGPERIGPTVNENFSHQTGGEVDNQMWKRNPSWKLFHADPFRNNWDSSSVHHVPQYSCHFWKRAYVRLLRLL